jgi:hypothetical protein
MIASQGRDMPIGARYNDVRMKPHAPVVVGFLLAVACSSVESTPASPDAAAEDATPRIRGTVDGNALGAGCADVGQCAAGARCVSYYGVAPEQSGARCVERASGCDVVTCFEGYRCTQKSINAPVDYVGCN